MFDVNGSIITKEGIGKKKEKNRHLLFSFHGAGVKIKVMLIMLVPLAVLSSDEFHFVNY